MPDQFRVTIQPVSSSSTQHVFQALQHFLGPGSEARVHELIQSGGTVLDGLNEEAAEHTAAQLRDAGAQVEVLPMEDSAGGSSRVRLISFGESKIRVIRAVREITGLGLRECKALVENLGVVKEDIGRVAAEKIKAKLEAAGATVAVEQIGGPEPEEPEDGEEFVVYGRVTRYNGDPAAGVLVRAFDKDLRTEQPLGKPPTGLPENSPPGSLSDKDGNYKITYKRDQFRRAEKHRADLLLRVFNEVGVRLAVEPSGVIYNARAEEKVDLEIAKGEPVQPSEYERLLAFLEPALEGVAPSNLTAADITFLAYETEIEAFEEEFPKGTESIPYLAHGSRLAGETGIPAEAFYGWAWKGLGVTRENSQITLDLKTLLEQDDETLREALVSAIEDDVIPGRMRERLDGILRRLRGLRIDTGLLTRHEVRVRLIDAQTSDPLIGFRVEATRDDEAVDVTLERDRPGTYVLVYHADEASGHTGRMLDVRVAAPDGEEVARESVPADQAEPFTIEVELPEPPAPAVPGHDISLEDLDGDLGEVLSNGLGNVLAERGATSLADVRRLVGRGRVDDLAEQFGNKTVRTLKAHAELSLVSSDAGVRSGLIGKGYRSPVEIADVPIERFVEDTRDLLGEDRGLALGYLARADVAYIDSVLTGASLERERTDDPFDMLPNVDPDALTEFLPLPECTCECNHALSPSAYLADLLDYVTNHLDLEEPEPLTLAFLHERFHQPFDRLPASCRYQQEQIRQVRICVEVLRGYIRAQEQSPETLQRLERLQEQEDAYRFEVYQRLLERLGATFDEVRRALTDEEERHTLADRLGIAGSHLENGDLYFEPGQISETDLERLLGYRRTTHPLGESDDPNLLEWRYEGLRAQWLEEDHPTDETGRPLVDPDLVDMKELAPGSNLYPLLDDRKQFVASALSAVQARARSMDGMDEILQQDLLTTRDELKTKHQEAEEGSDVSAFLDEHGLSAAAFRYMHGIIKALEAGQQPVESEWTEVHAITVEAKKRSMYEEWRRQEFIAEVTVSPDFFEFSRRDFTERLDETPSLRWRIDRRRRRGWEQTLRTRIQQKQALAEGLHTAVGAVEEAMLQVLRDALVEASAAPGATLEAKAEWITEQLQIDARTGGCRITTRVAQAIETIQNLVFSLRTGQLDPRVAAFEPLPESFDRDWKWMGSYATWKAATAVYLYPENVLQPTLRRQPTPGFESLVREVQGAQTFTSQQAREAAQGYREYFEDICTLNLQAACQAGRDEFVFAFATGKNRRHLYWSAYDPETDFDLAQTYWRPIPGAEPYSKIIGATPYTVDGKQFICFFWEIDDELFLSRFDLAEFDWVVESPRVLPLPFGTSPFEAIVEQLPSSSTSSPPRLIVSDFYEVFIGQLNHDANGWASDQEWEPIYAEREVNVKYTMPLYDRYSGLQSGLITEEHKVPLYTTIFKNIPVEIINSALDYGVHPFMRPVAAFRLSPGKTRLIFHLGSHLLAAVHSRTDERKRHIQWPIERKSDDVTILNPEVTTGTSERIKIEHEFDIEDHVEVIGATWSEVFWKNQSGKTFHQDSTGGGVIEGPPGINRIPPSNCASELLPYQGDVSNDSAPIIEDFSADSLRRIAVLAPVLVDYFDINDAEGVNGDSGERRIGILVAYIANSVRRLERRIPWSNLDYLAEAYYFVPLYLGQRLQQEGLFSAALDWYRTIYEYAAPTSRRRKIFDPALLEQEAVSSQTLERADDWFRDPLNPHSIARTRQDAYLRFTLLSIIRCLIEYADEEFTRDTGESLARARTLYVTALELLDLDTLRQDKPTCDELLIEIRNAVEQPDLVDIYRRLIESIIQHGDRGYVMKVAKAMKEHASASDAEKIEVVRGIARKAQTGQQVSNYAQIQRSQRELRSRAIAYLSAAPAFAQPLNGLATAVRNEIFHVAGDGNRFSHENIPGFLAPYAPRANHAFCIPSNPVVKALQRHASVSLQKQRTCRNIAGLQRQVEAYAVPAGMESGLPRTGAEGALILPGTTPLQPTPYRYHFLIDRAKELTNIAQQIEAAYLSAMQTRDAELYSRLKAGQDIELAHTGVRLQDLRVTQAEEQVNLAELQQDRARIQVEHYGDLINEGLLGIEKTAIGFMVASAALHAYAATVYAVGGFANNLNPITAITNTGEGAHLFGQSASALAAASSTTASILSTYASYKRREQEWKFARRLARHDVRIGAQQIQIAEGGVEVVEQERDIAELQADHAEATADFLANKDLNAELYDWMSGVLRRVYAFFLQQATATARLAEHQLAFERQQVFPGYIRSDYWKATTEAATSARQDGEDRDRLGLTGSARLLQDVYRLDQYAFETDQRKLQLSRNFSLARLDPVAFQRFRETGVMIFDTPAETFDQEFPGHYLRLIKRVRTSLIALTPPTRGIRATLTSAGISRVVAKGGIGTFQTNIIRRDPQMIAFTSPQNATGLFELNPQPEMLNPFEGSGVDTRWELRMPKAANPFDYDTIADVLVTLEYTALHSYDYERQVLREQDRSASGDRAFSFRQEFADAWYDLHNPDLTDTPMTVRFETRRGDFPPNLDQLSIQHVVFYFASKKGAAEEVEVASLRFLELQKDPENPNDWIAGGAARSVEGIISTRRGNAPTWSRFRAADSPIGTWELALPDTEDMRKRFKNEEMEDMLFVVTYSGRTPAWPA